jgi:DNA-binding winged helix-turn-helix (wHTH) protein/tetratricopeptide (TPR) repeat protein
MSILLIGTRRVDLERGEVEGHGLLGRRELALLRYFLDHRDRVVGQDELLREVWGFSLRVRTRALYTAVYRLRLMLEEDPSNPRIIRSERGEGYLFTLPRTQPPAPERLSAPPAPLIGRRDLLRQIREQLHQTRLVTLTGGPGMGKSRLGLELAQEHRTSDREVLTLRPGPSLLGAMCGAVGVTPSLRRSEVLEALSLSLERMGALLVVVDGAEQVDPTDIADLLEIVRSPQVRVLVTSRSPLQVPGERVVEVGPLTLEASIELLHQQISTPVERDRLAPLAVRVEGIPLALELGAVLVQTLGVGAATELLERSLGALAVAETHTRPGMTAAVLRSWHCLDQRERSQLIALVPFAGGFTLEQARRLLGEEAICAVAQLRTRSLVHLREDQRFAVFDTIREFVARIAPVDELRAVRLQHAEWAVELARQAGREELLVEVHNLFAAADLLAEEGRLQEASELMRRVLSLPVPAATFQRASQRGLELAQDDDARSEFESTLASLLRVQGQLREALQLSRRAAEHAVRLEYRFHALYQQAESAVVLGEYDEAELSARELVELAPQLERGRALIAQLTLARVLVNQDAAAAIQLVDSLQAHFAPEDDMAWGYGETIRGFALTRLDPVRAEEHLQWIEEWHLQRQRVLQSRGLRSARLHLMVRAGRAREAAQLLAQLGPDPSRFPFDGLLLAWIAWLEGDLRQCHETLERTAACAEVLHDAYTESLALAALGMVTQQVGRWTQAEVLLRRAAVRHAGHRREILAWLAAGLAAEDPQRAEGMLVKVEPELLGARCARRLLDLTGEIPVLPDEHELLDRIGLELVLGRVSLRAC